VVVVEVEAGFVSDDLTAEIDLFVAGEDLLAEATSAAEAAVALAMAAIASDALALTADEEDKDGPDAVVEDEEAEEPPGLLPASIGGLIKLPVTAMAESVDASDEATFFFVSRIEISFAVRDLLLVFPSPFLVAPPSVVLDDWRFFFRS
jgi:hypothetical protein